MNDFSIGAMKARNIAAQFGVFEKAQNTEISSEETAEEVVKAHNVGDVHANGKWVWTEYKPGRFDWRPMKGRGGVDRTPKKGDEGASAKKEDESGKNTATAQATPSAGEKRVMSAIQTFSSKYTNKNLVELEKTPKGNWDVRYDGHRLGIINGDQITEAEARAAGFLPPEKAKQSGKSLPEPNEGEKWEDFAERYEKAYRKANPDTSRKNSDIRSDASKAWDKTHASGKKTPTVDDHAKKTPTKTLENAAKSDKAPGSIKGAAEAELKARKDAEIAKKLNLHSKGELATALTKIASEWDSYNDSEKTIIKQSISQARKHIIEEIEGGNFSTETMSCLADLQSIENYIKKTDSEPKPVGDIIKNLMSDLKAKTVADTTAGKEKVKGIVSKATALSDGKSISFSANGREIELKKDRTFDDGSSQYTLYEGGVGRYTSIDAEKVVKNLLDYYPEAKEVKSSNNTDGFAAKKVSDLAWDAIFRGEEESDTPLNEYAKGIKGKSEDYIKSFNKQIEDNLVSKYKKETGLSDEDARAKAKEYIDFLTDDADEDRTDSFIKNGLEEVVTSAMDEYDGDFPGAVTAKDYYNDEDFQEYLHNLLPEDIDIRDVWGEVQKFVKRILKNRK